MFCKTGPAAACVADYPEHIAPRSPQKHRPVSVILSEQTVNQHFKLAQCSQVASKTQTWEQYVSEKQLAEILKGHFPKHIAPR